MMAKVLMILSCLFWVHSIARRAGARRRDLFSLVVDRP